MCVPDRVDEGCEKERLKITLRIVFWKSMWFESLLPGDAEIWLYNESSNQNGRWGQPEESK